MVLDKSGFQEEPQEIITDLDKIGVRSDEINVAERNKEIQRTVLKLKATIRENSLSGLSAPQIGVFNRVFCINFSGDIRTFINPIITKATGLEIVKETCASIPGKTFIRPRHPEIEVCYSTPLGKLESKKFVGLAARVFQHLLDHLDGLLLPDIGLEVGDDFLNAPKEEQEEVVGLYLESLDLKRKDINTEIENDEDLKRLDGAIKFIEKVQKGEVKIVPGDPVAGQSNKENAENSD